MGLQQGTSDCDKLGGMRRIRACGIQDQWLREIQVEIELSINGEGNLFGDGMGIFMTKQRATQGPVFGFQDKFEGLGIFIDTYKNNRPGVVFPYVMAMNGDGQTAYDQANDGKANELAGCSVRKHLCGPRVTTNTTRHVDFAMLRSLPR